MTIPTLSTFELAVLVGLATGCVYALVAVAFNLVLSASGVFNLVTGALITGAVIGSYVLSVRAGWPIWAVVLGIAAMGAAAGSISELVAVRRLIRDARSVSHETMVSTLGLGLAGEALASILFGGNIYPVHSYVSTKPIVLGNLPIPPLYLVMPVVLIIVTVALELMLRRTQFGVVTRAVIADPDGASLAGISVARVVQFSFVAAGIMAAIAGFLMAPVLSASAFVGDSVMVYGFAAVAIGGFGSFRGGVFGGLFVGLVGGVAPAFFDPTWTLPLVYALVVLLLFVRPSGMFGRAGQFGAAGARRV